MGKHTKETPEELDSLNEDQIIALICVYVSK